MRILVTGGSGFAGRHLLAELVGTGDEVAATVLGDLPPAVHADRRLSGVRWLPMDVTSTESVGEVIAEYGAEVIYHLAGQASVSESIDDPLSTWEVNATGTLRLLEAISASPGKTRRLLVISSAEVYGAVDPAGQPIPPDAPLRPVTPYGASKAGAELLSFQMGGVAGIEVVVARSFNHIGPGQDGRFALPSMARQLVRMRRGQARRELRVGNLDVVRDFLDVRDVVRAYIELMASGRPGEAYNVCSGTARSLHSVVTRLIELSGTGATLLVDPERVRAVDIPMLVGDPGLLHDLGWRPRIALDETLGDLLGEANGRSE